MTEFIVYFSRTVLQWRLQHLAPHTKYMNCRNHCLVLNILVSKLLYFIKCNKLMTRRFWNHWKQQQVGIYPWWSIYTLVSCFQAALDALDAMITHKIEPERDGIRQQFVKPDNILFILFQACYFPSKPFI